MVFRRGDSGTGFMRRLSGGHEEYALQRDTHAGFLSDEEMWEVVLFLYDFTDRTPREVGEFVDE